MPFTKALIRGYIVGSTLLLSGMAAAVFGGAVEEMVNPILKNIVPKPESIVRTADKICWGWEADKMRPASIVNIDAIVNNNGDLSFPEIIDETTGRVFHSAGSRPPGHLRYNVCIAASSSIKPTDGLSIQLRIHYAGALPLWQVVVTYPDVIVPPMAP